ncbi:alpha/beta hydrolase [Streptomyces purpureus]|uniref:alpha/beta hydrolase n=1 Tax=Streptomyces purpureus TaxID=1951 RepID=UPI0037B139BD
MTTRRTLIKSAVASGVLLGTGTAHARPSRDLVLRLPAPTGPYPVGATTLHLTDHTRPDPWKPELPSRELMLTVFHPARTAHGHPPAPHMSPGAAALVPHIDAVHLHPELPTSGVNWAATTTHTHLGAPALPGRHPVLLYTPGGGDPRAFGTGLAEDLASHGYVVVSVDHPGETTEVEFPDGRIVTTELAGNPKEDTALFHRMIDARLADVAFVLDQLPSLLDGLGIRSSGLIGIYGHSAGGTTAAQTLHDDPRVRAAVNLEGYLDDPSGALFPIARDRVTRPLLLAGTDGFRDARFDRSWSAARGRVRIRRLNGADHWVFTDYAAFAPQLQAAGLMTPAERAGFVGPIAPSRSIPWVRTVVRSFFRTALPTRP